MTDRLKAGRSVGYAKADSERRMQRVYNGVGAGEIEGVEWRKSGRSGVNGNCVEVARLAGGGVAVRNSRFPEGPALIYTLDEITAFVEGVKGGEFDFVL